MQILSYFFLFGLWRFGCITPPQTQILEQMPFRRKISSSSFIWSSNLNTKSIFFFLGTVKVVDVVCLAWYNPECVCRSTQEDADVVSGSQMLGISAVSVSLLLSPPRIPSASYLSVYYHLILPSFVWPPCVVHVAAHADATACDGHWPTAPSSQPSALSLIHHAPYVRLLLKLVTCFCLVFSWHQSILISVHRLVYSQCHFHSSIDSPY